MCVCDINEAEIVYIYGVQDILTQKKINKHIKLQLNDPRTHKQREHRAHQVYITRVFMFQIDLFLASNFCKIVNSYCGAFIYQYFFQFIM